MFPSARPTYYVTTPIYYVNGHPHLGHAYTSIAADVLARWKRRMGHDVFFLTGVDEHGQKVEQAAARAGLDPQTYVDETARHFTAMNTALGISNDYFIRTTDAEHKSFCQTVWMDLKQKGYIYLSTYAGWYSTKDECYYSDSEIVRHADGSAVAIETGSEAIWIEEPSYYFKLTLFKEQIRKLLMEPGFLLPLSSRNEILSLLDTTEDVCISRTSFSWGIRVPDDEAHVMYVWIDALMNYISALAINKKLDFWPADLHLIGKEIARFHAIIWPALLMALDYPVPKKIFAHGWWTVEGRKMGKSVGNAMSYETAIAEFGLDRLRYYLLREMPFGNDGDFSRANFLRITNADLANDLGNLAQRTLSIITKQGKVPEITQKLERPDLELLFKAGALEKAIDQALDRQAFTEALDAVWDAVRAANAYISVQAPWSKDIAPERVQTILGVLLEVQKVIASVLIPFMPESMAKLADQLASPLTPPTPIFPRIAA